MTHQQIRYFIFCLSSMLALLSPAISEALAKSSIQLVPIGVFSSGVIDKKAAEIIAHDPATQRLFVVNDSDASIDGTKSGIDVLDISDPAIPKFLFAIDTTPYGAHANSVAIQDNTVAVAVAVAVAVENNNPQAPGAAVFFDTNGRFLNTITVGALPDMITFTPDGNWVLTANEGEPNNAYTNDPEGSVSIIDLRGGVSSASVRTADFSAFNNAVLDPSIRIFGPGATVAQDLEPEYIAISNDSDTAWITLQENNALAIVDIPSATVTELKGFGFKDHASPGNNLDASDKDGVINITNWPIKGMYQPDDIAAYRANGQTFLITANEGDVRELMGLTKKSGPVTLNWIPLLFQMPAHSS